MNPSCAKVIIAEACCALVMQLSWAAPAHTKEKVAYSFETGTDGQDPYASLIDVESTLYGTTLGGGSYGGGTVFALDSKTDVERVIYSFCSQQNCADGDYVFGGLIDVNGKLYGTTTSGGPYADDSSGTVFVVDPATGDEQVLYSFCAQQNCADGQWPYTGLTEMGGELYGTTQQGGRSDAGEVFAVDPNTGSESVVYSFCSLKNCADGLGPQQGDGLVNVNGMLYGATPQGGTNCLSNNGCGVVYALDPTTGTETVLYSFCSLAACADGHEPAATPIMVKGVLYGTTFSGGTYSYGVVFAIDPIHGTETVLHSFGEGADGVQPGAGLVERNGMLYGTTLGGGTHGGGTAYELDPSTGAEKVIYSFCREQNCTDGNYPSANLVNVKGSLYGTTPYGGVYGNGTVFKLKKP